MSHENIHAYITAVLTILGIGIPVVISIKNLTTQIHADHDASCVKTNEENHGTTGNVLGIAAIVGSEHTEESRRCWKSVLWQKGGGG